VRNIRWTGVVVALMMAMGLATDSRATVEDSAAAPATRGVGCPVWMCGTNSPVVDGASIQEPAPATIWVGCPVWMCGSNSPVVDGATIAEQAPRPSAADRSFHELNMNGLPNNVGFRVVGVRKGTMRYALEGRGSALAAQPLDPGAPRLDGEGLVDLVFELRDSAARGYAVRIAATNTTRFWAEPFGPVRTYALTWAPVNAPAARPLCTSEPNEAILFQGDRYDSLAKTLVATGEAASGWINIACAGTALAKLYLTRHTEASQMIPTTRGELQSMLKMFTADVCGDGTSFTVAGQPLLWADAKGITKFAGPAASIEAIWTEAGAVCLDTPRKPDLAPLIAARCQRPGCGGATTAKGRGPVISANPR
jgi:hypothetical protein